MILMIHKQTTVPCAIYRVVGAKAFGMVCLILTAPADMAVSFKVVGHAK